MQLIVHLYMVVHFAMQFSACRHEIHAALGQLLLDGGHGLEVDLVAAAEQFTLAADQAAEQGGSLGC